MSRRSASRLTTIVAALAAAGCSIFGGVRVDALDASTQKPSNVALYVSVTEHDEPVTDLEPKNFHVFEDGQELEPRLIDRTLLPREPFTDERVLLLIDVSAKPSAAQRANYTEAVEAFVRKLAQSVPVGVRAFDGSPGLKAVGDYPRGVGNVSAGALGKLASKDASRDLNGAVLAGLAELDKAAASVRKPIHLGTLVVFARGPDLAGRTDQGKLAEALAASHYDVIGVGIGPDTPYLDFAQGGVIHAQNADTLPIALEEAGSRVAATHGKYYLVTYCSPARAGHRTVRLDVTHENKDGDQHTGSVQYEFDAEGFAPGCHADTAPRFEHPAAPGLKKSSAAQVNQAPVVDPDAVVPPPASGDYAK